MPTARHIRGVLRTRQLTAAEIREDGMLSVITVRSEKAHARIIRVRPPTLPEGVHWIDATVLSARATVRLRGDTVPILAADMVRYVGEPVGLLVGPDRDELMSVRDDVRITYEEFEPTFAIDEQSEQSVFRSVEREDGNIAEAFRDPYDLVEQHCTTGLQEHFYPEPNVAFAAYRGNGHFEVTCATQWPHLVRRTVAETAGVRAANVRIYAVEPGQALEGKVWFPAIVASHAALAARRTGQPCLLRYSRSEDLMVTPKRPATRIRQRAALDEHGAMVGVDVEIRYDAGAYPILTDETLRRMLVAGLGAYRAENARVRISAYRTNSVPTGPITGIEAPAWYAAEALAATIVRRTESDPVEWKQRNVIAPGAANHVQEAPAEELPVQSLMEKSAKESDFHRKFAAFELQRKNRGSIFGQIEPARGIGIAIGSQGTGFSGRDEEHVPSMVRLELDEEGKVWLYSSARPASAALQAMWKQTLATRLGVEPDSVRFASCDTDTVPDSGPTIFSRALGQQTRLIEQACTAVLARRFDQPLPISAQRSYRRPRRQAWDTETHSGQPYPARSWAACVVEVEVDPVSFDSLVRGVWMAIDGGKILDFSGARQTILATINHALSWTTRPPITGAGIARPLEGHHGFSAPFRQEPHSHIDFVSHDRKSSTHPLGIGELPYFCIPAAFAQAIEQATGTTSLPLPSSPVSIFQSFERGER